MAKTKVLKKEWYPIVGPKLFRNAVIGESYVYELDKIVGKGLRQNLMNLSNDVKRQNVTIDFRVGKVENGKAFAEMTGYRMVPASIKRLVRRGIDKVDMSFECSTMDHKNIRIKPFMITRSITNNSVNANLRKTAKDFIIRYISKISYDNFTNDLVSHKLQSELKSHLKKIYPLKICEIRSMKITSVSKKSSVEKAEDKPEIKEEPVEEKTAKKTTETEEMEPKDNIKEDKKPAKIEEREAKDNIKEDKKPAKIEEREAKDNIKEDNQKS